MKKLFSALIFAALSFCGVAQAATQWTYQYAGLTHWGGNTVNALATVTFDDCTVLFVQLGDDAGATTFLKSLDNDLKPAGALFDIVDVKTTADVYAASSIAELIQAALND